MESSPGPLTVDALSPASIAAIDQVLVADDDPLYRAMLVSSLTKWNFKVVAAADGLQAWDILCHDTAPKLIVLDWMMPGLSGIELCQRIRDRKNAPYSYVLLLTSRDEKQDVLRGLAAGADEYLTKPFDAVELRARLRAGVRILSLQEALIRKEEEIRFEALHDHLTGLWNRGAILDFLDREMARARRTLQPVGVMMVDIDHFKAVNDTHGHLVGDAALREVSRRLGSSVRQYDWIGRYGGEEFMAVVSSCDEKFLGAYAERMRIRVAADPVHTSAGELRVTVSIGAAVAVSGSQPEADVLTQAADDALYRAKHNGRNRVELTVLDIEGQPHPLDYAPDNVVFTDGEIPPSTIALDGRSTL